MANACATIKTLLDGAWTKANTDSKTPNVVNSQDEKDPWNKQRFDTSTTDFIKIYEEGPEMRQTAGIGPSPIHRQTTVAVDVMVGFTQAHALKVRDEVYRIIETNLASPGGEFQYIETPYRIQTFSGTRDQRLWRWVISLTLVKTAASIGA